uniref:YqaJ viral recombinase domain-containing protein n=1 Tax=Panagrolaimus superbus TaxID=310955 RepID=A0A914Z3S6_9BILA
MDFFGIKNASTQTASDFVIRKELFKNILKKNVLNKYVNLEDVELPKMETNFVKKPVLFEHFEALNSITKDIKDGSLITNRCPLRLLGLNESCSLRMFSIVKDIDGEEKKFIVLQSAPSRKSWSSLAAYKIGIGLEATIAEDISTYVTYRYNKFTVKNGKSSIIDIHYSAQIDIFDGCGDPVEIKALNFKKLNGNKELPMDFALKTVLQCKIGKTDKLLLGFNTYPENNDILIKSFMIPDIYVGRVKTAVDSALTRMKENLTKIINEYQTKYDGRIIRIEKCVLNENKDFFTFIVMDKLDL